MKFSIAHSIVVTAFLCGMLFHASQSLALQHSDTTKIDSATSVFKVVELSDVNVQGKIRRVDDLGSKIIYNVYQEKINIAISTIDLLRRTPLVTVDVNGGVSLKGNPNVKILVNNRDPGILSSNQILEQIPPSEVFRIEVITTPGTKYEAQGTAGVINIVTYKKMYFKSSGYLNVGVGTKGSHLMGNFNKAINTNWHFQNSFYGLIGYSKTSMSSNLAGDMDGFSLGQLYSYQTGITKNTNKEELHINGQFMYQYMRNKENWSDKFRQTMKSGYQYLSASADYTLNMTEKTVMNLSTRFFYIPTSNTLDYLGVTTFTGNHIVGQISSIDWTFKPIKKFEIATGARFNYSHFDNQYGYDKLSDIETFGTYANAKVQFNPIISVEGGGRYEYYHINTTNKRKKNYHDFFYHMGINYKINATSTLCFQFSKRTDRPSYAMLLTDDTYQGGNVVQRGNSNIEPAYSYLIEPGVSFYIGDCYFKLTPYMRNTHHALTQLMTIDNAILRQTSVNIEKEKDYGCNLWSTLSLFKGMLNFNGGINFSRKSFHTTSGDNNSNNQILFSINSTIRFSNSLYANCYGSWASKKIFLQGQESSYLYSNFSIQKSWKNDHIRLALSLDNPFVSAIIIKRDYNIQGMGYHSHMKYHNRGIRLFFIYKFGKHDLENNLKIEQNILNKY